MTAKTDDPIVSHALSDLRAWSDALPAYDVDAGAARHVELLTTGASASALQGGVSSSGRAWWIAGASAVVALGLVSVLSRGQSVTAMVPGLVRAPIGVVAQPVASAAVIETRGDREPSPSPAVLVPVDDPPPPEPTPRRSREARPRAVAPVAPVASDDLERELAIVRRMRRSLSDDPRQVLALASEATREFGRGVFAEERAALRVFALARIGDAAVPAAAAKFLEDFGDGPFAAKVARIRDGEASHGEVQ